LLGHSRLLGRHQQTIGNQSAEHLRHEPKALTDAVLQQRQEITANLGKCCPE
jgi:hypothetical protein